MEEIIVRRNELYDQVWKEPMSSLARRYNISDVGLAKVCRKLNVPIPPHGYWAKVQSGQKPIKPELPKLSQGTPQTATISPVVSPLRDLPEAVRFQRSFEADPTHRIVVNSDRILHPLVQATKTALSTHHQGGSSTVPLNIRVSEGIRDRALLLMSAMIYALEERGFSAEAAGEKCGSALIIKGERLEFSLWERTTRVNVLQSEKKHSWESDYRFDPTGKLTFQIQEYGTSGHRKSWSDGEKRSLEEQLNDMIPKLVDISLIIREERLERERRWAQIEEEGRLRRLAESRWARLQQDQRKWESAFHLRTLIEKVSEMESAEESNKPEVERWLKWANWVLASLDPLADGLGAFLKNYEF